jgi:hypothetical protein
VSLLDLFVNPEEIGQKLHATPVVPFRVHTSDGKHLDVMHPEMAMLTRIALLIARPVADPTREIPAHYDSVSPLQIVRIEPLVPLDCKIDN